MVKVEESDCNYSIYESIEYICDVCKETSLKVERMDDFEYFEELFNCDDGSEDLICWECYNKLKKD